MYPSKPLTKKQRKKALREARARDKEFAKKLRERGVFRSGNDRSGLQARADQLEKKKDILKAEYDKVKYIPEDEMTAQERRALNDWRNWFNR